MCLKNKDTSTFTSCCVKQINVCVRRYQHCTELKQTKKTAYFSGPFTSFFKNRLSGCTLVEIPPRSSVRLQDVCMNWYIFHCHLVDFFYSELLFIWRMQNNNYAIYLKYKNDKLIYNFISQKCTVYHFTILYIRNFMNMGTTLFINLRR